MIIVYSNKRLNIDGIYCNPIYFNGVNDKASLIYTDKEEIKKAYEYVGIEVKSFNGDAENKKDKPKNAIDNITHWAYPKELLTQKGKLSSHKKAEIELFNKKFADDVAQGTILEDEAWEKLHPNDDIELFRITEEVV